MAPKKKKEKDFQKKKLNVGGSNPRTNATNISFKSKAIVVPTQSVTNFDDDSGSDSNKASTQLMALLVALGHYSPSNRKDALVRLKEMIGDESEVFILHLGQVMSAICPMLLDREFDVRRSLIQFTKVLLATVSKHHLQPFLSVVVTYSCSAMNHIINEIRFDAVRFLNNWIDSLPDSFSGCAGQVLQNYMNLLNIKKQKVAGQDLFIKKSKEAAMDTDQITVLASFYKLLKLNGRDSFLVSKIGELHSLYFKKVIFCLVNELSFDQDISLRKYKSRWSDYPKWNADIESSDLKVVDSAKPTDRITLSINEPVSTARVLSIGDFGPRELLVGVLPACIDIWLESVPSVLSGSLITESAQLEKLRLTVGVMHLSLQNNILSLREEDRQNFALLLVKHILVYFPFGESAVGVKTEKCEEILLEMNVKMCEIISYFRSTDWPAHGNENDWETTLFNFILQMITGNGDSSLQLHSLKMIFPLCSNVCRSRNDKSLELLRALVKRHKQTSTKLAVWADIFYFLQGLFTSASSGFDDILRTEWITYLPKSLWSLSSSNHSLTTSILSVLSRFYRTNSGENFKLFENVLNTLIPFFHVSVPSKGPLFGPFLFLPTDCQKQALEVLFYVPVWPEKLINALAACLTCPALGVSIQLRALEIVFLRQDSLTTKLDSDLFYAFVFTVGIMGSTSSCLENMEFASGTEFPDYTASNRSFMDLAKNALLERSCESVRAVDLARRRVFLAKMVAEYLLWSEGRDSVLESLESLVQNVICLDSWFGICGLLVGVIEDGQLYQNSATSKEIADLSVRSVLVCINSDYELFKVCVQ
ncbi:Testis-expressed sequence 10 protein [Entophlyctis luteolus]|nr:Testis-expressed sequence 10 protein [Entophlyctis luteolus]